MADTIGVKIQLDGAPEFAQNMKQMAAQTKEFKAQLDLATSGFSKSTSAFTKSRTLTAAYKNQLSALKDEQAAVAQQIEKVSNSENANQTYVTNLKAKYAELGAQINETQGKIKDLGGNLGAIGAQMQEVGTKVSAVGSKVSQVGGTLTATVTAPLVAGAASAVKSFGDVDKQFRLVESTMGDTKNTTADFDNLWNTMSKDAANSVYTMQDSADALLNFARQGFTAKESADMLQPALSLAAGTGTDLATVTSGLGNTMKAFGASSSDAANYADILAKAQAQANTDTTNLFEAMSVAAPICKTVGWNMSDLATIVDLFGDAGISGSEGANALKTGLARLAAPAKTGAISMHKLGLETGQTYAIFDKNGTMKDMTTVLGNLRDAFSGLSQQEKLEAASNIFGKNQMSKWLTLIDSAPETVESYRSSLDNCTDTANQMADALMSGVGGSIEQLQSTFDVFKTQIGKDIQDPVKNLLGSVTDLMNGFMSLDEETQKDIIHWAAVAAAIGPVLLVVGKTVTGVGNLITATGKITEALGKATTSVDGFGAALKAGVTSPMGLAVAGVGSFILTYKALDAVFTAALPGYAEQKQAIAQLKDEMKQTESANRQMATSIQSAVQNVSTTGATLDLWKSKLNECFDAQGNLKSGCEQTASVVLNQLNEAMGTQYSISAQGFIQNTDGSRVSLKSLNDEIDKTVDSMKRQAMQSALGSEYTTALQNEAAAQRALNDAIGMYNDAVEKGLPQQHNYGLNVEKLAQQLGVAEGNLNGISNTMSMVADSTTYSAQQCEDAFTSITTNANTAGDSYKNMATEAVHTGDQITASANGVTTATQTMSASVDSIANSASASASKFNQTFTDAANKFAVSTNLINSSADKSKITITNAFDIAGKKSTETSIKINSDALKSQLEITKNINTAKKNMDSGVDSMQKKVSGAKWNWPKLKLPHFNISGSFDLLKGQVPHLSVDWYAKAMQAGMILNSPTIFGMQGGRLLGAGEAGPEVVVGASSLSKMIMNSVSAVGGAGRQTIINVYGAEGQDVRDLAQRVADIIGGDVQTNEAVFA